MELFLKYISSIVGMLGILFCFLRSSTKHAADRILGNILNLLWSAGVLKKWPFQEVLSQLLSYYRLVMVMWPANDPAWPCPLQHACVMYCIRPSRRSVFVVIVVVKNSQLFLQSVMQLVESFCLWKLVKLQTLVVNWYQWRLYCGHVTGRWLGLNVNVFQKKKSAISFKYHRESSILCLFP